MKEVRYLIAVIVILVLLALVVPKSCNEPIVIDNSQYFTQLDSLVALNDSLKANSKVLELKLSEAKNRKDSVVYVTKNHYIMTYDTITNDSVECLPKPYVDSLTESFEYVLEQSDSLIVAKNSQIGNLEKQNEIKDTIILGYKNNEKEYTKALKKEKRKKWLFGAGGFISGVIVGKL